MEWFLGVLRGTGIPVQAASWFADVLALVGAAQAVENHLSSPGEDPALVGMSDYLAMLPPDRFPNLTTVGAEMARGGAGDGSEFALELLLRGLATFVAPAGRH